VFAEDFDGITGLELDLMVISTLFRLLMKQYIE
jgi:hypothetical protein